MLKGFIAGVAVANALEWVAHIYFAWCTPCRTTAL